MQVGRPIVKDYKISRPEDATLALRDRASTLRNLPVKRGVKRAGRAVSGSPWAAVEQADPAVLAVLLNGLRSTPMTDPVYARGLIAVEQAFGWARYEFPGSRSTRGIVRRPKAVA